MNLFTRSKAQSTNHIPNPLSAAFLKLPPLKRDFDSGHLYIVPRIVERASGEMTHLDNAWRHHTRALLAGAPGMGKSAALEFMAAQERVPVYSFADYHAQALPEKFANPARILLDDVSESAHVAHLEKLATQYPHAKIWAATADAQFNPNGYTTLDLQPLNEREIVSLSEAWFPMAVGKGHAAKRINRPAQDFMASVQANAGTRELAITPLYLYLLLQVYEPSAQKVHAEEKAAPQPDMQVALPMVGGNAATPFAVPVRTHVAALPARRARLFEAYVDARLAAESDPAFAARAVEGIALSTKRGQRASADHLARGYGLLEERASGRVEFKHALLQDFLAARALRRNPDFAPMREHLNDPEWRDVALFYAGLGQAQEIVNAVLEEEQGVAPDGGDAAAVGGEGAPARGAVDAQRLYTAGSLLAAAPEPPAKILEQTVKALVARAWEDGDLRAMRVLGELRSNLASDFFAAKLKDKNADVRERAAFVLGSLHTDRALEYLLPQLRDPSTEVREQVIASLGKSRSERVVEPLLVALRGDPRVASSDTRLKIAAAKALGEYGTDKAVPALIVDVQVSDEEVRTQAVAALEKIRSGFAVKPLTAISETDKHPEVRVAATSILADMQGN